MCLPLYAPHQHLFKTTLFWGIRLLFSPSFFQLYFFFRVLCTLRTSICTAPEHRTFSTFGEKIKISKSAFFFQALIDFPLYYLFFLLIFCYGTPLVKVVVYFCASTLVISMLETMCCSNLSSYTQIPSNKRSFLLRARL